MPATIKYSSTELKELQEDYPNLYFIKSENKIRGELDFCVRYELRCGVGDYLIVGCDRSKNDCIQDVYSIEIRLNEVDETTSLPKVYETDGRIIAFAKYMGKKLDDLHINEDRNCCLGIFATYGHMSLRNFVREKVLNYFVWQAYYEKYKEIPPCKDCPHDEQEALAVRIADEKHKRDFFISKRSEKSMGKDRNNPCSCGSKKKYKQCCLHSDERIEKEICNANYQLAYLEQRLRKLVQKSSNQKP